MPGLLDPIDVGAWRLAHRVMMAPLTRCRAGPGHVPTPLMAEYYRQRADPVRGASLIVSEATVVAPEGHGYPDTPGIYTAAQQAGWARVTEAVHAAGGRIVLQLWHVGRLSHPDFQPGGALPVAPSAIDPGGVARVDAAGTKKPRVAPRALDLAEIPRVVRAYSDAAARARDAGFDGVEVHGANGYLPDQFMRDASNTRTDAYGGPIENRARFLLEVVDASIAAWGPARVGVRLSPSGNYHAMRDSDPRATFGHAIDRLAERPLAYAHVMRSLDGSPEALAHEIPMSFFRARFPGVLISNGRYTPEEADATIRAGVIDAVAFGPLFIANPDLAERLRLRARGEDVPLARADESRYYGGGAEGYTDYPPWRGGPVQASIL